MNNVTLEKELKNLKKEYNQFFKKQDDQSLFYLIQMIELMYTELVSEIQKKDSLYDIVYNNYKNNISIIFSNMKDYFLKITDSAITGFNQIITISDTNKYININNLNSIYKNFENELNSNMKIKQKIEVLINSTSASLLKELQVLSNGKDSYQIVNKYKTLIINELIKNVSSKTNFVLLNYKKVITNLLDEIQEGSQKLIDMNKKIIINTTLAYLKEQEHFIINNYVNDNYNFLNQEFISFEKELLKELGAKRNSKELNNTKDYLLSFNNTIGVKTKNIFQEMNNVITFEDKEIGNKSKEYNDLISHIYEINLVFDKEYSKYKKEFNVNAKDYEKFTKIFDDETLKITNYIKTNISNIFREGTKLFNDTLYKYLFLKSRIEEFNEVLSSSKVKDLLSK